jgi:hypothetical protein
MSDPTGTEKLVEEAVRQALNSPDPSTLKATVGVAEGMAATGATEVGGAGTGAWLWIGATAAAYPVATAVVGVALTAIAAIGITQAAIWGFHKFEPGAPEKQINAQYEIVNNPLPDNPKPFTEVEPQSRSTTPSIQGAPAPVTQAPVKARGEFRSDSDYIAYCSKAIDACQKVCGDQYQTGPHRNGLHWADCLGGCRKTYDACYRF